MRAYFNSFLIDEKLKWITSSQESRTLHVSDHMAIASELSQTIAPVSMVALYLFWQQMKPASSSIHIIGHEIFKSIFTLSSDCWLKIYKPQLYSVTSDHKTHLQPYMNIESRCELRWASKIPLRWLPKRGTLQRACLKLGLRFETTPRSVARAILLYSSISLHTYLISVFPEEHLLAAKRVCCTLRLKQHEL